MKQKLKDGWNSKSKMTCSEFVADVLGYGNPSKFNPQDILDKL